VDHFTDKQARAEAILGELAELGLVLARELAAQARACEEPADAERLAQAFNKTSRAVRLTLALDAKLTRDAARLAHEAAEADRQAERDAQEEVRRRESAARQARCDAPPSPVERHKQRVAGLLNRLLWNESEGEAEAFDVLTEDLGARLDEAALCEGFLEVPVETLAQGVAADMGLSETLVLTRRSGPCALDPGRGPEPPPAPGPAPVVADTG